MVELWQSADEPAGQQPLRTGMLDPSMKLLLRLLRRIRSGHLTVVLPAGTRVEIDSGQRPDLSVTLVVHRARAVRRVLVSGSVGFADGYIAGDWTTPDLATLIELALCNEAALGQEIAGQPLALLLHRIRHWKHRNTLRGSRRNIARHYDLGNDFYALWLDGGMTYSSALFVSPQQSLRDAQDTKYHRLAHLLDLRCGHHVLEIGCGWGGFAEYLAKAGCRVTGLTLSSRQAAFARERLQQAQLDAQVTILEQDYRAVRGRFDRIASIEMFEAVGEAYWPTFFAVMRDRLVAGGIAAMQVITIDEARFAAYRRCVDFIQHYIFPGGMLPTMAALRTEIGRAGLRVTHRTSFGSSYALTLARWQERFQNAWPQVRSLGFDDRFKRTWEYYLSYCEAGFRAGSIDVCQLRIERPT